MTDTRRELIEDIRSEVLGPRSGPEETLPIDRDPRDEYVTGVLAPASIGATREDVIDAESEVISPAVSIDEDQSLDAPIAGGWRTSPALDPKSLPRSLGISFAMTGEDPTIEICATWARYERQDVWHRVPAAWLSHLPKS